MDSYESNPQARRRERQYSLLVHVMRHEEPVNKIHNEIDFSTKDPELTDRGMKRCLERFSPRFFKEFPRGVVLYSSPLKRSIQTVASCFTHHLNAGASITLLSELQSYSTGPNGTAKTIWEIKREWKDQVSVTLLKPDYNSTQTRKTSQRKAYLMKLIQKGWEEGQHELLFGTHSSVLCNVFYNKEDYDEKTLHSFIWDAWNGELVPLSEEEVARCRNADERGFSWTTTFGDTFGEW